MVAGLMLGLASKSKSASHFSRGNPAALTRRIGAAPGPVVALGQQQLGEEPAVGELLLLRGDQRVADPAADGRQPQNPAGLSTAASAACSVIPRRRRNGAVIVAVVVLVVAVMTRVLRTTASCRCGGWVRRVSSWS